MIVVDFGRDWLSIQEAADYLGVARSTIYRWAKEGKLPIYKLAGGVARVKARDLAMFVAEAKPLYRVGKSPSPESNPILKVLGCIAGQSIPPGEIDAELYGKEPGGHG